MRNASFYFVQNHSNSECIVVNLQTSSFSVKHTDLDEKLLRFTKTFIEDLSRIFIFLRYNVTVEYQTIMSRFTI